MPSFLRTGGRSKFNAGFLKRSPASRLAGGNQTKIKMGTLGNQPPRSTFESGLDSFIDDVKRVSEEQGISFQDGLKAAEILEMRRRNLMYRQDGDYRDEQLGGFADLLRDLIVILERKLEDAY